MSSRSGVRVAGPLAAFAPGFAEVLVARGYRPGSAADLLRLMAEVSRWLGERDLAAGDLTVVAAERFAAERRAAGRSRLRSARALIPLLSHLRGLGVVPLPVAAAPATPAEVLIERYSAYLLEGRGLAASSVRNYVGVARVFLADRERVRGELALTELDGAAVSEFVLRESRRSSVGSAKCMVTRLRAWLRFLHVDAEIERDLAGAVPSVASWRLASLVKALDAGSVARLLLSCDRRPRVGRRDFAVLTVLSRLGLRVAIACSDFPFLWPIHGDVPIQVAYGADAASFLELPVASPAPHRSALAAAPAPPAGAPARHVTVTRDGPSGRVEAAIVEDVVTTTVNACATLTVRTTVKAAATPGRLDQAAGEATARARLEGLMPQAIDVTAGVRAHAREPLHLHGEVVVGGVPFFERSWSR